MSLTSFSALQRAENSSTVAVRSPSGRRRVSVLFSEPKIPQRDGTDAVTSILPRFSALQRAENSSTKARLIILADADVFQCSSASRKFLNRWAIDEIVHVDLMFQCSSASRKFLKAPPAV